MVAHFVTVLFTGFIIYTAWPGSSLFSWHPTLMALAFVTFMFEGLLVFNPQSSIILSAARMTKITTHWLLQATAVTFACLGFAVIYYNKYINDKPHFTTWHGFFGVITVFYIIVQSTGGAFVKYQFLRNLVKMRLADLKLYHATSGLCAFTLVCITLILALFSNWFSSQVTGTSWYACFACVSCMAMIVMNQITTEYLPKTRVPSKTTTTKMNKKQK